MFFLTFEMSILSIDIDNIVLLMASSQSIHQVISNTVVDKVKGTLSTVVYVCTTNNISVSHMFVYTKKVVLFFPLCEPGEKGECWLVCHE